MLTTQPLSPAHKELIRLFQKLSPEQQSTVLSFMRFLIAESQTQKEPPSPQSPLPIERPEQESVVAAMRRLTQTYPMLDTSAFLDQASALMSAHLLQGRAAAEVIDELEALFDQHYQIYLKTFKQ